jgi:hypothetical protein
MERWTPRYHITRFSLLAFSLLSGFLQLPTILADSRPAFALPLTGANPDGLGIQQ